MYSGQWNGELANSYYKENHVSNIVHYLWADREILIKRQFPI